MLSRTILPVVTVLFVGGCGNLWSEPEILVAIESPSEAQRGTIPIQFTLTGDSGQTDVLVTFNTDGSSSYRPATDAEEGAGTEGLSVEPEGVEHQFLWDSAADLPGDRQDSVIIRIRPVNDFAENSEPFAVHNRVFVAALEDAPEGSVRLHDLSLTSGSLTFLSQQPTGGDGPQAIVFTKGFFIVGHETSNDFSVLSLDPEAELLRPTLGLPEAPLRVPGDGSGIVDLAAHEEFIYAANPGSETIGIYRLDPTTGDFAASVHSGVSAAGCQRLMASRGRLYVVSETLQGLLVFDIEDNGALTERGQSPLTPASFQDPGLLIDFETRVLVANRSAASIVGFDAPAELDLSEQTGSPFFVSSANVVAFASAGGWLHALTSTDQRLLALEIDPFGQLGERFAAVDILADGRDLAGIDSILLAVRDTDEPFRLWEVDPDGSLARIVARPQTDNARFLRLAVSD